ncbi:MAG: MFS transporter [Bacteroidia bacterium]
MSSRIISLYKTAFSGLSKETWLLSLIMLINRSGTMVVPFMTLYLTSKNMNYTLSDAGVVIALFGVGSAVGAYFGGKFTDKFGHYNIQLLSLIGGGILFIVLGQLKTYWLICIFTFLLSLVNEAFRPANSSAIAYYSNPGTTTRSYSLNRLSINLGWAVGGSFGGLIAAYNYELLFWVDGLTNIGAGILLFIFLKAPATKQHKTNTSEAVTPLHSAYKDTNYLYFLFFVFLFAFCFFQLFTTVPNFFRDNLLLSERYIGLLMAINGGIIVAFEMILIHSMERQNRNLTYIASGLVLCGLAFLSLLLPGSGAWVSLLMIFLISAGEIFAMPFMNTFWALRSNERNRGQYAAMYTIAWSMAQTTGPFLSTKLVEATNFNVLFYVLAGILMLGAAGFYWLKQKEFKSKA